MSEASTARRDLVERVVERARVELIAELLLESRRAPLAGALELAEAELVRTDGDHATRVARRQRSLEAQEEDEDQGDAPDDHRRDPTLAAAQTLEHERSRPFLRIVESSLSPEGAPDDEMTQWSAGA